MLETISQLLDQSLHDPIFLSVLIILATFIMEDPVTIIVGSLIAEGKITFWTGVGPLFIGIFLGDLGLYLAGRFIKTKFLWKRLSNVKINSYSLVFWARFVPGMRVSTYPAAGYLGFPFLNFCIINLFSSVIWTTLILKGSMLLTSIIPKELRPYKWPIIALFILSLVTIELLIRKKIKSRRLF